MRFQTEMQHQVPDLRSAPIHEHSIPYSPISTQQRSASLDPQQPKEFMIPIQRPSAYTRRFLILIFLFVKFIAQELFKIF